MAAFVRLLQACPGTRRDVTQIRRRGGEGTWAATLEMAGELFELAMLHAISTSPAARLRRVVDISDLSAIVLLDIHNARP